VSEKASESGSSDRQKDKRTRIATIAQYSAPHARSDAKHLAIDIGLCFWTERACAVRLQAASHEDDLEDDLEVVVIAGQVTAGRGKASGDLERFRPELVDLMGGPLYPGSLNLVLHQPIELQNAFAFAFGEGTRLMWPARVNELPVWLYRWRGAPFHIVEVCAQFGLRHELDVTDGDEVRVTIAANFVRSLRFLPRIRWSLFWMGRKRLYYTSDSYVTFTRRLDSCAQKPFDFLRFRFSLGSK